jgi:hypothetical protein
MRKEKSHAVADQFSDDDMAQIKRYGQALGGSPTPFDEEVEKYLRSIETNKKKMKPARTGGSAQRKADKAIGAKRETKKRR